ncbi:hypothetical protein L207DRAFT_430794, partial [Hyaloscypha variabilis F]
ESLSETFRVAIIVTRKLGIRYLWIDSLCIFQDFADDWQKEWFLVREAIIHALLDIGQNLNIPVGKLSDSKYIFS